MVIRMVSSFNDILKYLPPRLTDKIKLAITDTGQTFFDYRDGGDFITELRLRRGRKASLTLSSGRNIPLNVYCQSGEISCVVTRMTENSMHTHAPTVRHGYIRLPDGCRVGLCGRAVTDTMTGVGRRSSAAGISNLSEITSVCIRLEHRGTGASDGIFDILNADRFRGGVLFYGPPCSGKTTLLRDLAVRAASGENPLRVAVVDERGEFRDETEMQNALIDLLDGYPKGEGIEQATRTLAPELIICDEIGGMRDAQAILEAMNSGVPLAASAHAGSFEELMRRPPIKLLYDSFVFLRYIGISRDSSLRGGLRFLIHDSDGKIQNGTE